MGAEALNCELGVDIEVPPPLCRQGELHSLDLAG